LSQAQNVATAGTGLRALPAPPGPELPIQLDRSKRQSLRSQLEDVLRESVRTARLRGGTRLPASRVLASDLGVSRRLVVEAYAQLLAEGYLVARAGAGTFVADSAVAASAPASRPTPPTIAFDFFPGHPDLLGFPRTAWSRALREALREMTPSGLGYPDARGAQELRRTLAGHLARVRGAAADPEAIVVVSGASQGLALLVRALARRRGQSGQAQGPHVAVEDPGLPPHHALLASHGARLSTLAVDDAGAAVGELAAIERRRGALDAVVVTPAHQLPTGVALAAERRMALLDWARAREGVVVEDDYDAEYRYDRAPLASLQGLAPDRVVYLGTASKTLAPALRLGWMVLPPGLVDAVSEEALLAGATTPTIDQLALARMIESGAYDRHLRQARRRYRLRRDALVAAVARHMPEAHVTGLAAGLHAVVRLPRDVDGAALVRAAYERSVGVYPLGFSFAEPRPEHDELLLGYANLPEPAIEEGMRRLAAALGTL
jgi:GntR family transcriptional regulator/MocR family aminotransferase